MTGEGFTCCLVVFLFYTLYSSLTRPIQLRGASSLLGGHCSEPQRSNDVWRLCVAGLLPLSRLSNERDRWEMNHAAPLSTSTCSPFSHLTVASLLLGICLSCPLFLALCLHQFLLLLSTPVCPLHLLLHPSFSSLFFNAYAHWWISNVWPWLFTQSDWLQTLCFLHFLKPHSCYFISSVFKLRLSVQLLSCEYKQRFKWQLQNACMYLCMCVFVSVCLHELSHQHLKDLTDKQQLADVSTALLSVHDE